MTKSNSSANGARSLTTPLEKFDPEEIRRLIELGKKRGLIHGPGEKLGIDKNFSLLPIKGLVWGWIDVTPALATKWLHNNFGNRPVREDTVRAYARDMINGVWVPTHQGIAFNDEDVLIDGQHRLKAVILSGRTIRFMVTFGLPSRIQGSEMTTMDAVDRGATRSVGDQLAIQHGFKNGSKTAQLCSALASLCCGERTRRLSVGQTLEVYRAFEKSASYVIEHRSKETGVRVAGVMAGFAFALATELLPFGQVSGWDKETPLSAMFIALITGENLKEGSAIHQLRKFLTSDESKLFTPTLNRGLAELTLQAILLEQQGRPGENLEAALDGANHFRSLQPDRVAAIAKIFKLPEATQPAPKPVKEPKRISEVEKNAKLFDALPTPAKRATPVPHFAGKKSAGRKRSFRLAFEHSENPERLTRPNLTHAAPPAARKPSAPLPPPTAKEIEWRKLRGDVPAPIDTEEDIYR